MMLKYYGERNIKLLLCNLRRTPPSSEALRHSGDERRLWTSATDTLYLDVELSRDSRPGTVQNSSPGFIGAAGLLPLTPALQSVSSDLTFRRELKTFLFNISFPDN